MMIQKKSFLLNFKRVFEIVLTKFNDVCIFFYTVICVTANPEIRESHPIVIKCGLY
jgi:hypothetical protein